MGTISKYNLMARTLPRLGFGNVARVAAYRAQLKLPSKLKKLSADSPQGPFFDKPEIVSDGPEPSTLWQDTGEVFSFHPFPISDTPPDWLANPLTDAKVKTSDRPWYDIPDFDPDVGDIKLIWELSRFAWLPALAQRAKRGDLDAFNRLNFWLEDWVIHNPPYRGPNWKCGQEASLRVLHLIVAQHILGRATPAFEDLIALHLKRIAPTVSYAMAQDNNHGTSEAAALFIGGHFIGDKSYESLGRKLLENRVARLVGEDGSFAQYSVVYHRLFLDALSLSEWWRNNKNLPKFSNGFETKMRATSDWLYRLTDPMTGDAPNMGANDGAQILRLTDAPYRDFRPSTALAQALWWDRRVYQDNPSCERHLGWLNVSVSETNSNTDIQLSDAGLNGGFAVLASENFGGDTRIVLRHPRFKFRPSQSDALHLDLWHKGENLLRDGGTYSYNTEPNVMAYFNGAAGHNTVQFDGVDQMPRLGRFLLGDWLKTDKFEISDTHVLARYENRRGHAHQRDAKFRTDALCITDAVSGFKNHAVLRWRLIDDAYKLSQIDETSWALHGPRLSLIITAPHPIQATITTGEESRHYLSKTPCPVLEITTDTAQSLITYIKL